MSWLIADLTNIPTPKNDNFESILSKILAWSYSQHKITKQDWHENNRKQCINDPIYVRNCTYIFTICKISIQKLLDTLKFLSTCMNVQKHLLPWLHSIIFWKYMSKTNQNIYFLLQ